MGRHTFSYLDLNDIVGGWAELHKSVPDWISEIRKPSYEPLSKEDEYDLFVRYHKSSGHHKAIFRDAIIKRNLRFVANIARHYIHNEVDVEELIASGNSALVIAFNKFDHERGVKFITYAVNNIRAHMIQVLRDASVVKLPRQAIQVINDFMFYGDADLMIKAHPDRYTSTVFELEDKIDMLLRARYSVSLGEAHPKGETLGDHIPGGLGIYNEGSRADVINEIMKTYKLSNLETEILNRNFGLNGFDQMGLRAIAEKLESNLTKVSKIRKEALHKMSKNPYLFEMLQDFNESDAVKYAGDESK